MGQMRFRVHYRNRVSPEILKRIYAAGSEEIPFPTRASWQDGELVVERSTSGSGNVSIPWQIGDQEPTVLTTATLMERKRPYQLEVELARGLIQRIRIRLSIWQWLGLVVPQHLLDRLQAATREFSLAATTQNMPAEAAVAAQRAISQAYSVGQELVADYAQQAIAARQKQAPLTTLLGVSLGAELPTVQTRRQLVDSCNIAQLPVAWRAIETREGHRDWKITDQQLAWCQKSGLKISAGPLLQLNEFGVPDWMVLWEDDFDNLARLMLEHVRAVVTKYSGRVHLWHVASHVNTSKLLSLEEEQRLYLVAQTLEVVRQLDPRTPTVVSFDQPWAEYLSHKEEDLAPLNYADALVRADLGVSGFGLNINMGYQPDGSGQRHPFELGRLLDQWSVWGLPLMINLSTPSSATPDPMAKRDIQVDFANASSDSQHDWAASVLPLLLARSTVQVILWNQLTDASPHEFPHAGLFDAQGQAKPLVGLMRNLRKSCLM